MKIRPVILCGGAGTRLWSNSKNPQIKQFIDFGNWTLLDKTLKRVKSSIFDAPIISTNKSYLSQVKKHLKKANILKYKIILEPLKKDTAAAILCACLIKEIANNQTIMFFSADHLIEKINIFNKAINKHKKYLTDQNLFIFGIKPDSPSSEYGYFLTKKINTNLNKVTKFIEKPKTLKAKKIIKQNGYWNSGMFFLRKDSIINNFKKFQPTIYKHCFNAVQNAQINSNTIYLKKSSYNKITAKSFDYAILEKSKKICAIKLNIPWSDLGSWSEILKMYNNNKKRYMKNSKIFNRPWGKFINLYRGKQFLIKELYIKPKGILSLQKHFYRSEHWLITKGKPKITLNKSKFFKKVNENVYIPSKAIHRIENPGKKSVTIMEAQIGFNLKESDIVRYDDLYGRHI